MYEIEIKKQVVKIINKRTPKERVKIAQSFLLLQQKLHRGDLDIKKLSNTKTDYRLRFVKYRFLYTIFENLLLISMYKAYTRGDIYKG